MPDKDGYPAKDEIRKLKIMAMPISKGFPQNRNKALLKLLNHLEFIWHWPEWGFIKRKGFARISRKACIKVELHTGGWSGNEEIIGVLQGSWFWFLYWRRSDIGGHYYFEIRKEIE